MKKTKIVTIRRLIELFTLVRDYFQDFVDRKVERHENEWSDGMCLGLSNVTIEEHVAYDKYLYLWI